MNAPCKWYALTDKVKIKYLGKHFTPHDAQLRMPDDIVMLLDEDDAGELRAQLDRHLGDDGYKDKYKPYNETQP